MERKYYRSQPSLEGGLPSFYRVVPSFAERLAGPPAETSAGEWNRRSDTADGVATPPVPKRRPGHRGVATLRCPTIPPVRRRFE